jgi:hypothetical protein
VAVHPEDPETLDTLERVARREIDDLRRTRRLLSSLPRDGRRLGLLRESLQARLRTGEDRLVAIVGLMGRPQALELVRRSLHRGEGETRATALEAFETLGDRRLAGEILPLLEAGPGTNPLPEDPRAVREVVLELMSDADSWLRALAIHALPEPEIGQLHSKLQELRGDPDPLVREAAAQALRQPDEVKPMDTLQTLPTLERLLLLREVPLFCSLPPEDLKQIAEIAREQWYPQGENLCQEGEAGESMFIIVSGEVEVIKGREDKRKSLAVRSPGEVIGEMALLDSQPRMATLRARGDVRVLAIESEAFKTVLSDRPEVSSALLVSMARRLRESAG